MILPTTTVEPFFRTTAGGSGFQLNELEDVQRQAQSILLDVIVNKDCVCHLIENQAMAETDEK